MQQKNDLLGNIFFTEYDEKITGSSMRDPLGLEPIWSYYGRRVIKHLTTVSADIRGFREVLLCLSVCENVMNRQGGGDFREMILIFEQLFIYSAIKNGLNDGIIGADNGNSRYRVGNGNPVVSGTDTILVREISLGYYGRYKTPLLTMKIIDKYSHVRNDIDVESLYGSERYNSIADAFEAFLNFKQEERSFKKYKASDRLFEAVCENWRAEEEKFWLESLQISGGNSDAMMEECYCACASQDRVEDMFRGLPQHDEVSDILKLEPFLVCVESVFYRVLSSKNISAVALDEDTLKEHRARFDEFKNVSEPTGVASEIVKKRMKTLKSCSPDSPQYVENVIKFHRDVSNQKHSSVWLEDEPDGAVQVFVQPDISDIDINKWGRNYYMSSLLGIRKGIEGLRQ